MTLILSFQKTLNDLSGHKGTENINYNNVTFEETFNSPLTTLTPVAIFVFNIVSFAFKDKFRMAT